MTLTWKVFWGPYSIGLNSIVLIENKQKKKVNFEYYGEAHRLKVTKELIHINNLTNILKRIWPIPMNMTMRDFDGNIL
jgi:hypothetical protein